MPLQISEEAIEFMRRAIDYEADCQRMWYDECTKEGYKGSCLQKCYQTGNNVLYNLRSKMNAEYLAQFETNIHPRAKPIYTNEKTNP